MRILKILLTITLLWQPITLQASELIPTCRYDDSLIPIVKQAMDWAIADYRADKKNLPFEHVVYNSTLENSDKTLSVYLVKDATLSTVNDQGCIVDRYFHIGGSQIKTDGDCIPTDLSKCTVIDKNYMESRFSEADGSFLDNTQTGYGITGACYMTNLQACLHRDYMELLEAIGPRDGLSVKGSCLAEPTPPMSIRCSAGALKMMLSWEAAKDKAPTVGILFMLAHELAHLIRNESSTYDSNDYVVDRAWSREDKFKKLNYQCIEGDSNRRIEQSADELALMVTRQHIKEISERWPKQGTMSWLISQVGHFSTNLARLNNDWHDGPLADVPDAFQPHFSPDLSDKELAYLDKEEVPSGFDKREIRMRAKMFLCELAQTQPGKWVILIQSGTTHGTMVERVAQTIGMLRKGVDTSNDSLEGFEGLLGKLVDLGTRRHRGYLREIEEEICDLIEKPVICPGDIPAN